MYLNQFEGLSFYIHCPPTAYSPGFAESFKLALSRALCGFSLTGHISASTSLTTDITHCLSPRANPAALF